MPLRPYGSRSKLRPYGSKAMQPDPLTVVRADIDRLLAEQQQLIAEERRLFALVDKFDRNGKRDTPKAYETKDAWQATWRRLERNNAALHAYVNRERNLTNGKV